VYPTSVAEPVERQLSAGARAEVFLALKLKKRYLSSGTIGNHKLSIVTTFDQGVQGVTTVYIS
jgi:hypothetical protein